MATKRLDQLTAHPESITSPFNPASLFVTRDPTLSSDNTRKMRWDHLMPYATNILHHGADPTGVADSTIAIQKAIDFVTDNGRDGQGEGTVFMPPGVYRISKIHVNEGVSLLGSGMGHGGTILYQSAGVNDHAIIQAQYTVDAFYIHGTHLENFYLLKEAGSDTVGSGIYFNSNLGENTKFTRLRIESFPEHGLHVTGAITGWFQDINTSENGIYGLFAELGGGHSFTGHYMIGISGDGNARALVGTQYTRVLIIGLKSETGGAQPWAVELNPGGETEFCQLINATHSGTGGGTPEAVVRIAPNPYSGAYVWLQGVCLHSGATAPTYLIKDDVRGKTVPFSLHVPFTVYSSRMGRDNVADDEGGVLFSINDLGCQISIAQGSDAQPTLNTFGLGQTNGVGQGASGNVTALAKGAATNAPTSLVVNKWVYATLDNVTGWIPFFT